MDANADVGVPLGQFTSQGRATGNEELNSAPDPGPHFREHEFVSQFPGERARSFAGKNLFSMATPDAQRPAVHLLFGELRRIQLDLGMNFFVHAGHA